MAYLAKLFNQISSLLFIHVTPRGTKVLPEKTLSQCSPLIHMGPYLSFGPNLGRTC